MTTLTPSLPSLPCTCYEWRGGRLSRELRRSTLTSVHREFSHCPGFYLFLITAFYSELWLVLYIEFQYIWGSYGWMACIIHNGMYMYNAQEETNKQKTYSSTFVENCIELRLKHCVKCLFQQYFLWRKGSLLLLFQTQCPWFGFLAYVTLG